MKSSRFPSPPRPAVWLVKRLERYQTNQAISDDIREVFARICQEHGLFLHAFGTGAMPGRRHERRSFLIMIEDNHDKELSKINSSDSE